jgi:hypothetical protein
MTKYFLWSSVFGMILACIIVIAGAWFFVNSSDKSTGQLFFKFGLLLMGGNLLWFIASLHRTRNKKKASI